MIDSLWSQLSGLMQKSRDVYHVDPVVFLVLYLVAAPVFWYSLVRVVRALAVGSRNEALRWSTVFLCAVVAPFLYVLFFGRNLPWWVYGIIGALVAQGVVSLVRKLRSTSTAARKGGL